MIILAEKDEIINLFDIKTANFLFIFIYSLTFDFQLNIFSKIFSFF